MAHTVNVLRQACAAAAALGLLCEAPAVHAMAVDCLNDNALRLRVRFADLGTEVLDAVLTGGPEQGLELRDARSGALWWSAGARATNLQYFGGMNGAFVSRPAAVDLDADGIVDRVYALDVSGRLWRLDLSGLRPRDRWAEGGILARLSPDAAQRFVAPLDVALQLSGPAPWISVAFGTVTLGAVPMANRFYLLRDRHPFADWHAVPDGAGWPITDADLRLAESSAMQPESSGGGFYLHLGAGQVIASSLTMAGRVFFTTAQVSLRLEGNCLRSAQPGGRAPVAAHSVSSEHGGTSQVPQHGELGELPVRSAVEIAAGAGPPGPRACVVAGIALDGCGIDTRVERTWWLREDAD